MLHIEESYFREGNSNPALGRGALPCHPEERRDGGSAPKELKAREQILRLPQDDRVSLFVDL